MFALAATVLALFVVYTGANLPPSVCTSTFTCYLYFAERKSWQDAYEHCKSLNADLVSIHSAEENQLVYSLSRDKTFSVCWIGFNDKSSEDNFEWSDGSSVDYTNWKTGEPNNKDRNFEEGEDCTEMIPQNTGIWNDDGCNVLNNYMCKKY